MRRFLTGIVVNGTLRKVVFSLGNGDVIIYIFSGIAY